jgi:hypothetical protein
MPRISAMTAMIARMIASERLEPPDALRELTDSSLPQATVATWESSLTRPRLRPARYYCQHFLMV